jgi:hypothetical protein
VIQRVRPEVAGPMTGSAKPGEAFPDYASHHPGYNLGYNFSARKRISRGARNPEKLVGSSIGSFIQ